MVTMSHWAEAGACSGLDPNIMVPVDQAGVERAKKVCAECTVTDLCLAYAMSHREEYGVWGGMSEAERRALRKMARELTS